MLISVHFSEGKGTTSSYHSLKKGAKLKNSQKGLPSPGCGGRGRRVLTSLIIYGVKASGIVCSHWASPPTLRKAWTLIPLPAVGEGKSLKSPRSAGNSAPYFQRTLARSEINPQNRAQLDETKKSSPLLIQVLALKCIAFNVSKRKG